MNKVKLVLFIALMFCVLAVAPAQADVSLGFFGISANNVSDVTIGEAQLWVNIIDLGTHVQFTFNNSGPFASSITDIYFDDGSLLGIASLIESSGVAFTELTSPGNLPSANSATPAFETTAGFSADSDPPAQPMGVNPGEWLGIVFDLQGSQDFSDVLNELESGALRIGIHVQGFVGGGSESFVNDPYDPYDPHFPPPTFIIPAPGALLLGSMGVGLVGWLRRRRTF